MDGDRDTMAEDEFKMDRDKAKMAKEADVGGCLERFGQCLGMMLLVNLAKEADSGGCLERFGCFESMTLLVHVAQKAEHRGCRFRGSRRSGRALWGGVLNQRKNIKKRKTLL